MLSSILPGVRHVRAPLAAGFVWLMALWFLFEPRWNQDKDAGGLLGSANRLMDTLNLLGQGVILSFVAYLLGSFSVLLFSRPIRSLFPTAIEPAPHLLDGLSQLGRVSLSQVAIDGRQRLEAQLVLSGVGVDEVLGLTAPLPDSKDKIAPVPVPRWKRMVEFIRAPTKQLRRRIWDDYTGPSSNSPAPLTAEEWQERDIAKRVLRDLPVVANAQLLGPEPEVFSAVDRSQAEVEFRIALVPALLALSLAVAVVAAPDNVLVPVAAIILGVLGAGGLVLDAARQHRESNELILSLMEHGRITPPSVSRAESMAAGLADQAPANVIKRQAEKTARAFRQYLAALEAVPSSGSVPTLDQAHKDSNLAHREAQELDRLLQQNVPALQSSRTAESVLEPLDRALSGWLAMNLGIFESGQLSVNVQNPKEVWPNGAPSPDELLRLINAGKAGNRDLASFIRNAVSDLAFREAGRATGTSNQAAAAPPAST